MPKQYIKTTWQDQVLAGALRFLIRDNGGATLYSNTQITVSTGITTPGTAINATNLQHMEDAIDAHDTLLSGVGPISPYKFVVTISSNDLVIALKDQSGNDFSTTNPGYFKINGVVRTVTTALSVTAAHGAQSGSGMFNAGAVEFSTKPIDYFIYLGWKSAATASVVIGVSRYPGMNIYSEFSATPANEKYAVFSTTPGASDDVTVIGRIEATNSGTASYNWTSASQSAPTSINTVQYPIWETRVLDWASVPTGYSANPTNVVYHYKIRRNTMVLFMRENTPGTSNATTKTYTAPLTAKTVTNMYWYTTTFAPIDNGAAGADGGAAIQSASNIINVYKSAAAAWTASGGCLAAAGLTLEYEIS